MKAKTSTLFLGHAPRIAFDVTKEDIKDATSRNSNNCMVAQALKRAYPNLRYVSVDIQTIRASDPKKRERYVWLTPRRVQQGIVDFDLGRSPTPCRVEFRDGQVTGMGGHGAKKKSKAKLRQPRGAAGHGRTVPERVGGKTPPKAVGQRREFGLRSMDR
jgi:hypothetical protein